MTRWNWKRWAWAIVTGTALTAAGANADDMPKSGETITLKFPGQPDRTVTIVKTTKKPDGSVETEVKDAKSGETFTLVDPAHPVSTPTPSKPAASSTMPPLPKPIASNPTAPPVLSSALPTPLPPVSAAPVKPTVPAPVVSKPMAPAAPPMESRLPTTFSDLPSLPRVESKPTSLPRVESKPTPMPQMPEPNDRRRLFNREPVGPATVPSSPAAAAATPVLSTPEDKRPGIIGRIFGSKKPTPPISPAATQPVKSTPAPIILAPVLPPTPRVNAEPPRIMPSKPVTPPAAPGRVEPVIPPTPAIPAAPTPPSAPSSSIPQPLPSVKPAPPVSVPSIPQPQQQSGIQVVPAVAMKTSKSPEPVRTASHTRVTMGLLAEIEPATATLRDALAPSARITAAKGLAEGRHGSSDAVKGVLFHAAKADPCPAVKAACIDHLCKLGYYDPAFLKHLKTACEDSSDEVRTAARAALAKMSPK